MTSVDPVSPTTIETSVGEQYLRLKLQKSIVAVVRLDAVKEVLSIPAERIAPIPYMPACTIGLLNKRSKIIWTIDLPQMLELQPLDRNRQIYSIAIIKSGNNPLALAVEKIEGVVRLESEAIQSPTGMVEPGLVPYLQGCAISENEKLWVLEPSSIVDSPVLGNELSLSRQSVSI